MNMLNVKKNETGDYLHLACEVCGCPFIGEKRDTCCDECRTVEEPKLKGYIAGPMFKDGDISQRKYERYALNQGLPNVEWFNPIEDNPSNDKTKSPTARDIFENDTQKILESNYFVAELDGEDPGTIMELGICLAWNLVHNTYERFGLEGMMSLLKNFPRKEIAVHGSDIRLDSRGYDGFHLPFGFNQYVVGGVEAVTGHSIIRHFYNVVDELKERGQ